jgi:hypothetical protein
MSQKPDVSQNDLASLVKGPATPVKASPQGPGLADYKGDLMGILLPLIAVAAPLAGAYAYTETAYGPIALIAAFLCMCFILREMAHMTYAPEKSTILAPLAFIATIGHYLLLCMVGVVAVPYAIIVTLGAGLGNIPMFESVMFIAFVIANGAYVASFSTD